MFDDVIEKIEERLKTIFNEHKESLAQKAAEVKEYSEEQMNELFDKLEFNSFAVIASKFLTRNEKGESFLDAEAAVRAYNAFNKIFSSLEEEETEASPVEPEIVN
jgi:hypothetical protein